MDYDTELDMVRHHIAEGQENLISQRRIVDQMQRAGRDSAVAKTLLQQFEDIQAMHREHLARLLRRGSAHD